MPSKKASLGTGMQVRWILPRYLTKTLTAVATTVKEYWFLITILASAVASIFYAVVFNVSPLDAVHEIKQRREQVKFHNTVGYTHLERGHYEFARAEFEKALNLRPVDYLGLNGRYLAEQFLEFKSPGWNPAISLVVQDHLRALGVIGRQELLHIVEKYRADVEWRTGSDEDAKAHYEKALALKPDYVDALFSYGWFNYYPRPAPDVSRMEQLFRKMTEVTPHDYRGFHGFGYALYMQALNEPEAERRRTLVIEAATQSLRASQLGISYLNILMDFGEIARSVNPSLSMKFREMGNRVLDDPEIGRLEGNTGAYGVTLLLGETGKRARIATRDEKRAWITYQLALDHLAAHRLEDSGRGDKALQRHEQLLARARELDPTGKVFPIYRDQLRILERLLSRESLK